MTGALPAAGVAFAGKGGQGGDHKGRPNITKPALDIQYGIYA